MVLVPNKLETFAHNREYTSLEHILWDEEMNTDENDLTHLPEILEKHDYDMDVECGGKIQFEMRAQKKYENRCLHQHVFCEDVLKEMFSKLGNGFVLQAFLIAGNIGIVYQKDK